MCLSGREVAGVGHAGLLDPGIGVENHQLVVHGHVVLQQGVEEAHGLVVGVVEAREPDVIVVRPSPYHELSACHVVEVQAIEREVRQRGVESPYLVEVEGVVRDQPAAAIVEHCDARIGVVVGHQGPIERCGQRASAGPGHKYVRRIGVVLEHVLIRGLGVHVSAVAYCPTRVLSHCGPEKNITRAVGDVNEGPVGEGVVPVVEVEDPSVVRVDRGGSARIVPVPDCGLESPPLELAAVVLPACAATLEVQHHPRWVGVPRPERVVRAVRALAVTTRVVPDPVDSVGRLPRRVEAGAVVVGSCGLVVGRCLVHATYDLVDVPHTVSIRIRVFAGAVIHRGCDVVVRGRFVYAPQNVCIGVLARL